MPMSSAATPRPPARGPAARRKAPGWPGRGPRSRGQALVELALILPITLMILLVAGDLARLFGSRVTIEGAARAGALEAARHPTSFQEAQPCDAQVNRVMCAVLTESNGSLVAITKDDVSLECLPSPCAEALGDQVRVSVVGHFALLTPMLAPFLGGQSIDLTSTATAQIAVHPAIAGTSPTPSPTPTPTPTPSPGPTPTPDPSASPTPTPTATPGPGPTPVCFDPVADFIRDPLDGKKKKTAFQFTDLSTSAAECPLTWSWNFGDGAGDSLSSLQNPSHVYEAQGTYTVTLVASNAGGSDTRTRTVLVTP